MEDLFQTALGIASPWFIESVKFNTEQSRLDIYVNFQKGSTFRDSIEDDPSGKAYTAFDTVKKTWRHLNFFQHECYLHARVPRIKRDDGRVRLIPPPWSGKLSGFTLLFEAFLIQMCRSMPIHHVSKITGVSDYRLWILLELYVNASRFDEDYSRLHTLGMDETSATKGHDYITLFVDLEEKKTLFVADGKSSDTVKAFTEDLKEHNGKPEQVKQVSCDMSPAFIKGVREELPSAEITFDKFHIIKIINEAVDKVRREEAKTNPLLKGAKYILLKNESNLTAKQKTHRESLSLPGLNLKSIRALQIRETFQQLYTATNREEFEARLKKWYFWATHSRLKPVINAAKTIKRHWDGVIQWKDSQINNGLLEGLNSVIQAAKRKAREYKKPHFKIMVYLLTGKLDFSRVSEACLPT
ncbi:ISL3 family transposase [Endozoicomonas sp. ALD040]|uniref:ISL3 family transposase n=1 Tax=unclassified Endozoicomonas TaxID=2644528 RepID=UPI003BB19D2A